MGLFGKKKEEQRRTKHEPEQSRTEQNRDSVAKKKSLLQIDIGKLEQKLDSLYETGKKLSKREKEQKDAYREFHSSFNEFEDEQRLDEIVRIQEEGKNLKRLRARLNNALDTCRNAFADLGIAGVSKDLARIAEQVDFRSIEEMVAEADAMEERIMKYTGTAKEIKDPMEGSRRKLKEEFSGEPSTEKLARRPDGEQSMYEKRRKDIISE